MIRKLTFVVAVGLLFLVVSPNYAKAQGIDCNTAGPNALQNAIDAGNSFIQFTGVCNELVFLYRRNITLQGTNPDTTQNVIVGGVTVYALESYLTNLRIQGQSLNIVDGGFAFLFDVLVDSTNFGAFIARNSGATFNDVFLGPALIDDGAQGCTPLCIGENSYLRMENSTVAGDTSDPVSGGAITVYRDASLLLRGGNTISNAGSTPVISVFGESSFRQDNSLNNGTDAITATGSGLAVEVSQTSSFDTREAVITGDIEVGRHSFMNVGSTVFGGDPSQMEIDGNIELSQDSALNVSSPLVTIDGDITCADDESSAVGSFAGSGTNACSGFDAEVVRDDGTAQFLVDENSASTSNRRLLRLENNGNPQIELTNTATSVNWRVGMGPANSFFAKKGSRELRFTEGGGLKVINGGDTVFDLRPSGNLVIDGNLTQLSDAGAKHDVTPLDEAEVLAQVAALPVSAWSYKDDETGARHAGPMAQDFHAAFGLGEDDTHISPMDAVGVALAAIKALQQEVHRKDAKILVLQARNAELEKNDLALQERLEAIERKLAD